MESEIKECEFCLEKATCLCYKCFTHFCDSCFNLAHRNEKRKSHKKEKIDYFIPINMKCKQHNLVPINLFCVDDKGNLFI